MDHLADGPIEVFATCPQSADHTSQTYLEHLRNVARWSEDHGCKGILVYSDNRLIDPWLVAQEILTHTTSLCPLVAVQPIYMHPYSVAKMVASFGYLYDRRIYLNMIAGGFKNDLVALNDTTSHDRRYDRLREYTFLIKELLAGGPVTYKGEFYEVSHLKLTPILPKALLPGIFMSGSSEAGLEACRAVGGTAIKYPKSSSEETTDADEAMPCGVRLGIIAREDEQEAWEIAYRRFPEDRRGQVTRQVAMKISDSVWHKQLSELAEQPRSDRNPYWLVPFQNYRTSCPYLVGSYARIGDELASYIRIGYRTFVLDIPATQDDLYHTAKAFDRAVGQVTT